ncbi:MAG: hypothetical protein C4308_02035 [Chitinophagaceae bacterium]
MLSVTETRNLGDASYITTWWFTKNGLDSAYTNGDATKTYQHTYKNGKLVKTIITGGDVYEYEYKPDGSCKKSTRMGSLK